MSNFTLDQRKAHDFTRHISITANAGSGKTRVLVSRYCDLLEYANADPGEIAAITFTEKAASELRSRIAAELEKRLSDDAHKSSWKLLKQAREKFTSALVTTIHGFCSRLLREFPIEAGISPTFSVLSGFERSRVLESSIEETIERVFDKEEVGEESYNRTYDTVRRIGRERAENILRMMLHKREAIAVSREDGVLAFHSKPETLALWNSSVETAVRNGLMDAKTMDAIGSLITLLRDDKKPEALQKLAEARAAHTVADLVAAFGGLCDVLLTKAGTPKLRSYSMPKDELVAVTTHPVGIISDALKSFDDFLDGDPGLHDQLYDDTQVLLEIFDRISERYDERKERINALDFEDLQLRVIRMLNNPDARKQIRERFTYIMVDEFQDTNRLQYSIARKLLEELNRGNLCVVGDVKQAIYGFRNAEVDVFAEANGNIQHSNANAGRPARYLKFRRENITAGSDEEAGGIIRLSASFRLLPDICSYVNATCAPIMVSSEENAFGVEYEPLVCARQSEGKGAIEFILARPEPKDREEEANEDGGEQQVYIPEEELVVRRILQLINNNEQVVWDTDAFGKELHRAPNLSDIAILCRRRAQFAPLESALRRHGIPFVTHGSTGFFATQEVYDISNYLRTLLNERDDIALIGLLRSPFFAVSDAELYRLTVGSTSAKTFWERARAHVESGTADKALQRALDVILDDRKMASRIPVSVLIRRVVERTGWRGAVVGTERGAQALANMDKVLELSRDFERQGFTNLFDFVEQLSAQIDEEDVEGEAPVSAGSDAVRLMTMHAAKGLEFPVVFLPSLHVPIRRSTQPYFDKDLGFGWSWRLNQTDYLPMILPLMELRQHQRERAEETRLFYVAATRARDMLVISGESDGESVQKNTMLDWALAPFGHIPMGNVSLKLYSPALRFLEPDGSTVRTQEWEQDIVFRTVLDLPEREGVGSESVRKPFRADALYIGELGAKPEGDIYSASQFFTYSQCPTKYYLKFRLGIPEDFASAYELDTDERDASEDGTVFARLFRLAAEKLDEMNEGGSEAVERIIAETVRLEPLPTETTEAMRERLHTCFTRLLSDAAAREVLFPPDSVSQTKHELRMPFGKEFIMGVMDRMSRTENGTLSILHYKTLRLPEADVESVAESFLPQLRFYAYLVFALRPEQRTVHATLLFTEHPHLPMTFTFNTFEARRIGEEIQDVVGKIHAISYSGGGISLPLKTAHCPHCPYFIRERCLLSGQ